MDKAEKMLLEKYGREKAAPAGGTETENRSTVKLSQRETADLAKIKPEQKTVTEEMTDEERYEVLKGKTIEVHPYDPARFSELQRADYEELERLLQGEFFNKTRAYNLQKKSEQRLVCSRITRTQTLT